MGMMTRHFRAVKIKYLASENICDNNIKFTGCPLSVLLLMLCEMLPVFFLLINMKQFLRLSLILLGFRCKS